MVRGVVSDWQRWEPAIQALCDGRPIYGPEVVERLVDGAGHRLDPGRSFAVDEPLDEMRAFFTTMGYLHVRDVFTPDEVAFWGAEIERCVAMSTPGDPYSWWSVNAAGDELVTRINHCERFSSVVVDLAHDPRLARYARLAGRDLRVCDDRLDGPMVFVKNPNMVKGNGDLEWHVDDGVGGHPVMCPLIQAGVQLDHANADNGQLLVLAGSHRYAKHWLTCGQEGDLPVVALDTRARRSHAALWRHDAHHAAADCRTTRVAGSSTTSSPSRRRSIGSRPHCHYNDVLFRPDPSGRVAARATSWD